MRKLLVLNGPNLNLLGGREPEFYGEISLNELEDILLDEAKKFNIAIECKQSNSEGQLVEWIHQADEEQVEFIIINPGAYTHTSIALRDAFLATDMPFIEVHISNTFSREKFRHKSYLSDVAISVIVGMGVLGYIFALQFICLGTAGPDNIEDIFDAR
ncbi:MAG: type II 3-dehydroquinate dehydratase [Gammaproteobacteria bacterium]|nr:type II 3-dehydroquinate dehydratase [Gammaproteobacteria bacterium]MCY4219324.1 type II 3-dehydroquinate dehydratase [Gammaproteobacteria bacterium]MCY4275316.1 type II 3-dehydroquinate dehydratase [Gammaproteobacteria bacterium]